jgi:hypothetical protein
MGRPKKRLRVSNDTSTTQDVSPAILPADEYASTVALDMPAANALDFTATSWLSPTAWPDFDWGELALKDHAEPPLIDQNTQSLGDPMARSGPHMIGSDHGRELEALDTPASIPNFTECACLSSLYLALHRLQSPCCDPRQVNFTHALQPLREAMQAASRVIPCQICPKRFLSAIQNVHLMGTLLVCIAERFGKVLSQLSDDAERASSVGELKSFRLLDVADSDADLCNLSTAAFQVVLGPDDARMICKKIVRAEVMGPGRDDNGTAHISLNGLCRSMRERQNRWHHMECPDDFPRDIRPARAAPPKNNSLGHHIADDGREGSEHFCIKMVSVAEKLIQSFDWS